MQFGLFSLMTRRERSQTPRQIYADMVEHVRLAEQMGFDVAWFAEHHFSNYCLCPSPLTLAMFVAPQTSRIRLGPAVVVAPLYQPLRLLEDIAVLDSVSNGRLVLGLGSGYQQYEFHKFGVDLKAGRDILLEVDGGIKVENIAEVAKAGADTFVAGSAIFGKPDYKAVIDAMRTELARK